MEKWSIGAQEDGKGGQKRKIASFQPPGLSGREDSS
jgi:hypothetical protein